jgi:hypothetical protein
MTKPRRQIGERDTTRDELVRALLDPEHPEADELGRTKLAEDDHEPSPRASPREQAAAPINLLKVDE